MSTLDMETKRKLRDMGATTILEAIASQDDALVMGMGFEQRMSLIVDEAYSSFSHNKVEGLIRRAGLRYPEADLRRIDMVEQRGLNHELLVSLATCGFIERHWGVMILVDGETHNRQGLRICQRLIHHSSSSNALMQC